MNKRRKPGVKVEPGLGSDVTRRTITVDDMTWRRLLVLGKGNASFGVREAARVAYDRYQGAQG
jgi:hypothetical protein